MLDHRSQEDQEWIAYYLPRAEADDPDAQIGVAWEYVRGVKFEKDLDAAIRWFRKAEASVGELAVFHLMKMCLIEEDDRIHQFFREKSEWNLGVIYMFYGLYLLKFGNPDQGMKHLETGKRRGHLISAIRLHQLRFRSLPLRLLAFPYEIFLAGKTATIHVQDPEDYRILV